jgi:hypothetical protein
MEEAAMQTVQFSGDDVGKSVVNDEGAEVGTISTVNDGTAYVELTPGTVTKDTAALGWDDIDDEYGYPLQKQAVESVTDDQIRLRSDL